MADSAIITMDLTRAGFELYGKINAELTPLHITRVVIGDGYLAEGETIYDLAAVKHEVSNVTVQIVSVENLGDGRSRMLIRITGQNKDFYLREIAVMAEDPDNGEIMYSGCNYGDMADYVMTYAGAAPVMQEGNIYFITGTGDLTVEVSHDNASVTHAEFEAHTNDKENPHNVTAEQLFENATALKTITHEKLSGYADAVSEKHTHENKGILDTITQAIINKWNSAVNHTTNRENPHGVTKSQIGLGNVPNVSTNDQKPTFTEAAERANIASGETLSTILGKIKKWFSALKSVAFSGSYNDLNDKPTLFSGKYSDLTGVPSSFTPATHYHTWSSIQNKPSSFTPSAHTHSKSDVGLEHVTNESKETMFTSPTFTGTPRATTANAGDSSTRVATTAFVMSAIENLKKLIGNAYIGDAIRSVNIQVLRVQNWGHSEYLYCLIACTGCTLTTGEYIRNSDPKYSRYGNGYMQGVGNFYVGIDPTTIIVTPVSEITLNGGILSIDDTLPNNYKTVYINTQNDLIWTDESDQHDEYAEYYVYDTVITL